MELEQDIRQPDNTPGRSAEQQPEQLMFEDWFEPEACNASEEEPDAGEQTLNARFLHRDIPLRRADVEGLASSLGRNADDALSLIQKGLNYERLMLSQPAAAAKTPRGFDEEWVAFFKDHRDIDPADFTESMLGDIESGHSPLEVFLKQKLADADAELAQLRAAEAAKRKDIGSLRSESAAPPADAFMQAFEQALRY